MSDLMQKIAEYHDFCMKLVKEAKIKKLPDGKYQVISMKGKNLGTYKTKEKAKHRLQQVEFFKLRDQNHAEALGTIDLTHAHDFSFSAMMREMRKEATPEQVREFLTLFKKNFDKFVKKELQNPEKLSLQNTLVEFNKKHPVKLQGKILKNAATSELGNASLVGKYLADIVKFTLNRIPVENRAKAIDSLRKKFYSFNAQEISQKHLPPTSSIGQSITFVKHVLMNQNPTYVRQVLNNLVANL